MVNIEYQGIIELLSANSVIFFYNSTTPLLLMNYLSVFDHFLGLALKGLSLAQTDQAFHTTAYSKKYKKWHSQTIRQLLRADV